MLAWSEELITDVRKLKSWLWRHCRRRAIYWLLRSHKLVTLNPRNSNQQAPDATSFFPVGGMPTASSLAWKTSPKSQDAGGITRNWCGALPMIDRGDIRQAIDRCSNIWASLPGAGYVSSSIRLTAWLQKIQSGRNGQRVWCMSRVTAIISFLIVSALIVCLSWAVSLPW